MAGILALVGGAEFQPGNEEQDRLLLAAGSPAYVLVTANGKHPDMAAQTAIRWFTSLGGKVEELRVRSRADAESPEVVKLAQQGKLFYLSGGNPGRVVDVLKGSPVWTALREAWQAGAALAGASAGAMALGRWSLSESGSEAKDALNLVGDAAVLPHYSQFGKDWLPFARQELGPQAWLLGLDERTALVHDQKGWKVLGPGEVHVIQGDKDASFRRPAQPQLRITVGRPT